MNSTNTLNKKFSPVGAMFMTVGGTAGTWKLGDIKPKEGTLVFKDEYLQEFDPTSGAIGQKYTYLDEATAKSKNPTRRWADPTKAVGWWKLDTVGGMTQTDEGTAVRADDVIIQPGAGFYSNFVGMKAKLNFPSSIPTAK